MRNTQKQQQQRAGNEHKICNRNQNKLALLQIFMSFSIPNSYKRQKRSPQPAWTLICYDLC